MKINGLEGLRKFCWQTTSALGQKRAQFYYALKLSIFTSVTSSCTISALHFRIEPILQNRSRMLVKFALRNQVKLENSTMTICSLKLRIFTFQRTNKFEAVIKKSLASVPKSSKLLFLSS